MLRLRRPQVFILSGNQSPRGNVFLSICMHPTTNLGPIRSIFSISTQELKCLYISVEIDRLGFKCL